LFWIRRRVTNARQLEVATMHRIVDSRCVLAVRDLQTSTRFYVDVLGFRRDFGDGRRPA
jgi:hypothetical protein